MKPYYRSKIIRIKNNNAEEIDDYIAVEKKVRISVNGRHVMSLYCTPRMIREFVVGIIFSEKLITGEWCAERISIIYGDDIDVDIPATGELNEGERTITSGCAGGVSIYRRLPDQKINDTIVFSLEKIKDIFGEFQRRSEIYRLTGGVHSAALTDSNKIFVFMEDIGRHNAVDKVIGYCILENISFEGKIMMVSGRISSEIVYKCAKAGIPMIISRAAPTSLAVEIAEKTGITLIGFMRGDRLNIYTNPERTGITVPLSSF